MKMQEVKSSMISRVGYDEQSRQLAVQFSNGTTYKYEGVPLTAYSELLAAKSVGRQFNAKISKSFPFTKA